MKFKLWQQQIIYAQQSMADSVSKGYTHKQAAQLHLDSLRFVGAIKTMEDAMGIVSKAAELNGMDLN